MSATYAGALPIGVGGVRDQNRQRLRLGRRLVALRLVEQGAVFRRPLGRGGAEPVVVLGRRLEVLDHLVTFGDRRHGDRYSRIPWIALGAGITLAGPVPLLWTAR